MIAFLILGTIILICVILFVCDVGDNGLCIVGIVIGSILFVLVSVILPCVRADIRAEIVAFKQTEVTVEMARQGKIESIERAALTNTVIECNNWLAKKQYRNKGPWDIFIPDEVDNLKMLK